MDEERIRSEMLESLDEELEMEISSSTSSRLSTKRGRASTAFITCFLIPREEVPHPRVMLPETVHNSDYLRGPIPKELYVPSVY